MTIIRDGDTIIMALINLHRRHEHDLNDDNTNMTIMMETRT